MKSIARMQPITFRTGLVASLSLLLLAGRSAEAEDSQSTAAAMQASGVLETSLGTFEFTPMGCGVHFEDGVLDIEIGGPGKTHGGEEFYFTLSSIANQIIVELGVDGPFKTSDRQLRAGQYSSDTFTVDVADEVISVTGLVLVNEQGDQVDANANLRIDCNL